MKYMVCLHFLASNNVAEYEALINGLHITIELGIRSLDIKGDSQLVINQVMNLPQPQDGYVLPGSPQVGGQV
jgi:ribonuclease HI